MSEHTTENVAGRLRRWWHSVKQEFDPFWCQYHRKIEASEVWHDHNGEHEDRLW